MLLIEPPPLSANKSLLICGWFLRQWLHSSILYRALFVIPIIILPKESKSSESRSKLNMNNGTCNRIFSKVHFQYRLIAVFCLLWMNLRHWIDNGLTHCIDASIDCSSWYQPIIPRFAAGPMEIFPYRAPIPGISDSGNCFFSPINTQRCLVFMRYDCCLNAAHSNALMAALTSVAGMASRSNRHQCINRHFPLKPTAGRVTLCLRV